jgi:aromatic-L-amino-acid/L-tryptophan decarboxylase
METNMNLQVKQEPAEQRRLQNEMQHEETIKSRQQVSEEGYQHMSQQSQKQKMSGRVSQQMTQHSQQHQMPERGSQPDMQQPQIANQAWQMPHRPGVQEVQNRPGGQGVQNLAERTSPLEMSPAEFRKIGYELVNKIAGFLEELPSKPVSPDLQPSDVQSLLGTGNLPEEGSDASDLLDESSGLLFNHSLFNGHPRFWGYITSSAAPIGALGDMLAAAVNPNVGSFALSPMATEMEKQTIRWIADLTGYPAGAGLFVSGGNMANFVGFLAARRAAGRPEIRREGIRRRGDEKFAVYCSRGTHTWVEKAADLFGYGTDVIRWIDTDAHERMDMDLLRNRIARDIADGCTPLMVVGNAGSVGTGSIDPLGEIAEVCKEHSVWFHIDGAYGAFANSLPEYSDLFRGLERADSIALDPHKWLYAPLEAGCVLVRDEKTLTDAFSYHPEYYNFSGETEPTTNFYEYGMQNSRGFRALKVWLSLRQAGRSGYISMIRDDIALAEALYRQTEEYDEIEGISWNLSITTFRYVPAGMNYGITAEEQYLNRLNEQLLNRLQEGGEIYLSNAVIGGKYCLRVCIVNFRTRLSDIMALPDIIVREGRRLDLELRSAIGTEAATA